MQTHYDLVDLKLLLCYEKRHVPITACKSMTSRQSLLLRLGLAPPLVVESVQLSPQRTTGKAEDANDDDVRRGLYLYLSPNLHSIIDLSVATVTLMLPSEV